MKLRKAPLSDKNKIGAKVIAFRKKNHIKQKDFIARLQTLGLDISQPSLSRLEYQERRVQDYEIPIIAKALGISIAELLVDYEQENCYK